MQCRTRSAFFIDPVNEILIKPILTVLFLAGGAWGALAILLARIRRRRELRKEEGHRAPAQEKLLRPPGYSASQRVEALTDDFVEAGVVVAGLGAGVAASVLFGGRFFWAWLNADPGSAIRGPISTVLALVLYVGALAVTLGLGLRQGRKLQRLDEERENWRLGVRGEQLVGEALNDPAILAAGYRIYHDVPGAEGWNIDHVVVGSSGVYVIETKARRDRGDRPSGDRGDRRDRPPRRDTDRPGGPRRDRPAGAPGEGRDRDRGPRPGGDRPGGPRNERSGGPRQPSRPRFEAPPELPQRPKAKRLKPGRKHRNAVMADLPEAQRALAERVLQGGLPAVRQAVNEQNARLKSEGKEEIPAAGLLAIAEQLQPKLRVAEWLDRADAAVADLDELDLRDLRSVVASGEDPIVARDETTREISATLKEALVAKQEKELNLWFGDIDAAIGVGRVVRALKLSSQPPKAGVRFPADLAGKLASAATASLTSDSLPDRWVAVLEAVAFSSLAMRLLKVLRSFH